MKQRIGSWQHIKNLAKLEGYHIIEYFILIGKIKKKSWNFRPGPGPLFHEVDLRIWIHMKMKWIHNTVFQKPPQKRSRLSWIYWFLVFTVSCWNLDFKTRYTNNSINVDAYTYVRKAQGRIFFQNMAVGKIESLD